MAVADVINSKAEKVAQVDLADEIFSVPVKTGILHAVVTAQLAARRSGTASVKNRSDVTGSRKKLFRQKGTGRARRGDVKSPLLRGGGVIFGPVKRSYAHKVPKKVKRLALKMALSSKRDAQALFVMDQLEMEQPKTKAFVETLRTLGLDNALIVIDKPNYALELSARNVPEVKVLQSAGLNVYDILKYEHLVLLKDTIGQIEGRLLK